MRPAFTGRIVILYAFETEEAAGVPRLEKIREKEGNDAKKERIQKTGSPRGIQQQMGGNGILLA